MHAVSVCKSKENKEIFFSREIYTKEDIIVFGVDLKLGINLKEYILIDFIIVIYLKFVS